MPQNAQPDRPVCTIIAARNAERTIANAIRSALNQAEIGEVVLVDDASTDRTSEVAQEASGGDGRLKILAPDTNLGPAAGRNLAIRSSSSPLIAILDADDAFVPGRFTHLLELDDWDLVADNIAFVTDILDTVPVGGARTEELDLEAFVRGNLSRKDVKRGELGFLKPVIRRSFLVKHGLSYDAALRLGEDYDLYVRCLIKGARFRLSHRVGYVAEVRDGSLSSQHGTRDLKALLGATDRHRQTGNLSVNERSALDALHSQTSRRYVLREFLDRKSELGPRAALAFALRPPSHLGPIVRGIMSDKLNAIGKSAPNSAVAKTLIPHHDALEPCRQASADQRQTAQMSGPPEPSKG